MSSEDRLARLGLSHLAYDSETLQHVLAERKAEHDARLAAWRKERDERAKKAAARRDSGFLPRSDERPERRRRSRRGAGSRSST